MKLILNGFMDVWWVKKSIRMKSCSQSQRFKHLLLYSDGSVTQTVIISHVNIIIMRMKFRPENVFLSLDFIGWRNKRSRWAGFDSVVHVRRRDHEYSPVSVKHGELRPGREVPRIYWSWGWEEKDTVATQIHFCKWYFIIKQFHWNHFRMKFTRIMS